MSSRYAHMELGWWQVTIWLISCTSAICDDDEKELKSAKKTVSQEIDDISYSFNPSTQAFCSLHLFSTIYLFPLLRRRTHNPHLLDINAAKAFFRKFIKDYEIWKREEISFISSKEIIESICICGNFKKILEIRLISYFHLNFILRLKALYMSSSFHLLSSFHILFNMECLNGVNARENGFLVWFLIHVDGKDLLCTFLVFGYIK